MYRGVSTRRIEGRLRTLWERLWSSGTVSNLNEKARSRPSRPGARGRSRAITLTFSADGIYSRRAAGEGPTRTWPFWPSASFHRRPGGHRLRGGLGTESADSWREFPVAQGRALRRAARHRRQGRAGCSVRSRRCSRARLKRCTVHLPKRVGKVPVTEEGRGAACWKAIHAQESRARRARGSGGGGGRAGRMRLGAAGEDGACATASPRLSPVGLLPSTGAESTNNGIERINRDQAEDESRRDLPGRQSGP